MSNLPKKKQQNNQNATHISNYGKKKKFIIAPNIEPRDLNSLLEEVHENKEQIEISRVYEKMPHATLLALEELMEDKIYFRMEEPVIEKTEQ